MFTLKLARSTRIALALASAALFATIIFPLSTQAADPSHMPKSYTEFMKMDPAECMKMIDHDNKGYVTKDEYMKFHAAFFDNMAKQKAKADERTAIDRVTRDQWIGRIQTGP